MLSRTIDLLVNIRAELFGTVFMYRVQRDVQQPIVGRVFIQITYKAPCGKTNKTEEWRSRKWYLSEHMTDDEIIKTAYLAFEIAVKHEILEGFKVNGKSLFNPHVNYTDLLTISDKEVKRK